jgi:hypothetical protein
MELGLSKRFAGILDTQVGYPRAHCGERGLDCISSDRVVTLPLLAVSHGKDEEVGELVVGVGDGIQGRGDPVFLAEVSPHPK